MGTLLCVLLITVCATTRVENPPPATQPNVLFVFSDAHRARSTGCYGDDQVRTPRIDSLAAEGLLLGTAISNTPLCKPYRAILMSGRLAHHTGILANTSEHNFHIDEHGHWQPGNKPTLGSSFSAAGYRCGYIGKWHLGDPACDPGPARLGFDDFWLAAEQPVHNYSRWSYRVSASEELSGAGGFRPAFETDRALEFIADPDPRPWLLMLSWGPPHEPFTPPEGFDEHPPVSAPANVPGRKAGRHGSTSLPAYDGLIEALDQQFGRLLQGLDAAGLAEDTLVIYTSDHGTMIGSQGRMGKELPFSESSQVPFLLRWPAHIPAGSRCAMPFGSADIYPTLAGLCGVDVPDGLDGRDFSRLFLGEPDAPRQLAVPMACYDGRLEGWPGWRGLRTERYLYATQQSGPWLLYDCQEDPDQLDNLVDSEPELVQRLGELTEELMARSGDSWDPGDD